MAIQGGASIFGARVTNGGMAFFNSGEAPVAASRVLSSTFRTARRSIFLRYAIAVFRGDIRDTSGGRRLCTVRGEANKSGVASCGSEVVLNFCGCTISDTPLNSSRNAMSIVSVNDIVPSATILVSVRGLVNGPDSVFIVRIKYW